MAYDFQKLADVELLEEVPDGASAFVAVDGAVKRVPGSGLGGGGGVATAILRLASESNASAKAVMRVGKPTTVNKLPITCDNYTYAQARAVLEAGNPLTAALCQNIGSSNFTAWASSTAVFFTDNLIVIEIALADDDKHSAVFWNADGFFNGDPADYNP